MTTKSPATTIPKEKPDTLANPLPAEGATWTDDGSTTDADDGDLCVVHKGNILIFKPDATTPNT